ncbi:MAG: hypothetical protein NTY34_02975 [Candidatus Omnitrophica bacterium]|nr:hypothetical protein [Candidatus Omnitrophota bacterium]
MTTRARHQILFKISAVVLSLLATLLFLEIALRIFGPKYYKFNNQSAVYYTNPRNYHIPIGKDGNDVIYGLVYTSSQSGYRFPDGTAYIDDRDDSSILGLGDSFTFGRGVKYEDIYLTVLQGLIKQGGRDIKIRNCGVIGHDIREVFDTYLLESSKKRYPIVIYGFVLNDFGLPVRIYGDDQIDLNNGGYAFDPIRKISGLYNFVCHLIDKKRLHDVTIKAYLKSFRGRNAENKFNLLREFHRDIKDRDGKFVIVLFPLLYDFASYPFREIHEKISVFCKGEGILLVDLFPAFSKYRAEELWVNPTDHHPNETAHKIAAGEIYKFFTQNKLLQAIDEKQE